MNSVFGMHASALSEVFSEALESLHACRSHLITEFREDLLHERATALAEYIQGQGAALEHCVGFIDYTNIQMCRSGGLVSTNAMCIPAIRGSTDSSTRL